MKKTQISLKKIFSTAAVFLLISAAQAYAGTVTLTGYFDWIVEVGTTGITPDSPVSLELNWQDEQDGTLVINPIGESTIDFDPALNNTFTLQVGGLSVTNSTLQGLTPYAHFTDGLLDGFELDWFNASIDGASGNAWSIYAVGFASDGDPNILWEIFEDNGLETDVWVNGYLDFPTGSGGTSPVPVPGAAWLLGSGLVGLAGLRRKMK